MNEYEEQSHTTYYFGHSTGPAFKIYLDRMHEAASNLKTTRTAFKNRAAASTAEVQQPITQMTAYGGIAEVSNAGNRYSMGRESAAAPQDSTI